MLAEVFCTLRRLLPIDPPPAVRFRDPGFVVDDGLPRGLPREEEGLDCGATCCAASLRLLFFAKTNRIISGNLCCVIHANRRKRRSTTWSGTLSCCTAPGDPADLAALRLGAGERLSMETDELSAPSNDGGRRESS
jgi:hypothetical protein